MIRRFSFVFLSLIFRFSFCLTWLFLSSLFVFLAARVALRECHSPFVRRSIAVSINFRRFPQKLKKLLMDCAVFSNDYIVLQTQSQNQIRIKSTL